MEKITLKKVDYGKGEDGGMVATETYSNGKVRKVPIKKGGIIDYIFGDDPLSEDQLAKFMCWAF